MTPQLYVEDKFAYSKLQNNKAAAYYSLEDSTVSTKFFLS